MCNSCSNRKGCCSYLNYCSPDYNRYDLWGMNNRYNYNYSYNNYPYNNYLHNNYSYNNYPLFGPTYYGRYDLGLYNLPYFRY